jgi:hypothetical protein
MKNLELETSQEIRTQRLVVRMTKEEKDLLFQESQKAGISISAFIRLLLLNWTNGVIFSKGK